MEITVSSRHVEVSPSLRQMAIDKVGRLARFVDGMQRAEVHFSEQRNPRIDRPEVCEVTLYGHGHQVRAKVSAADQFAAVDLAVDKLEHQLHKLKTRVVDRRNGKVRSAAGTSTAVLAPDDQEVPPRVVKTKRFPMKPMAVDEAVLQMELLGHEFFYFLSADSGEPAVVYRRADGDVGLIEAER